LIIKGSRKTAFPFMKGETITLSSFLSNVYLDYKKNRKNRLDTPLMNWFRKYFSIVLSVWIRFPSTVPQSSCVLLVLYFVWFMFTFLVMKESKNKCCFWRLNEMYDEMSWTQLILFWSSTVSYETWSNKNTSFFTVRINWLNINYVDKK